MRLLITGTSGLLGLTLALEASKHHQVFGVVNQQSLKTDAFQVIQSDLLIPGAMENLLQQTKPDWVIHCAALANLEACEVNRKQAQQLNSWLPAELANHVARGGARLVHISTDAVFNGRKGNYSEQDAPDPQSAYAETKLLGEQAVTHANPEAIIARVNFYGWSASARRSLAEFFFYNLKAGKSIPGFTDVHFCPLLTNDLAQILLEMLSNNLSGIFHVVSNDSISKYQFGKQLAQQFNFDEKLIIPASIQDAGMKATRSPLLTLNTEKIQLALGKPMPTIAKGLEHFHQLHRAGYTSYLQSFSVKTDK